MKSLVFEPIHSFERNPYFDLVALSARRITTTATRGSLGVASLKSSTTPLQIFFLPLSAIM